MNKFLVGDRVADLQLPQLMGTVVGFARASIVESNGCVRPIIKWDGYVFNERCNPASIKKITALEELARSGT